MLFIILVGSYNVMLRLVVIAIIAIRLVGQSMLANFCFGFLWQFGHGLDIAHSAICHCLLPYLQGILTSDSHTWICLATFVKGGSMFRGTSLFRFS